MILRSLALSVAFMMVGNRPGAAQAIALRPAASPLFRAAPIDVPSDSLNLPKTYWKEGAVISGAVVGLLGYQFAHWGCTDTDSGGDGRNCDLKSMAGFAVGFLAGAIPGALIGGQFKKH